MIAIKGMEGQVKEKVVQAFTNSTRGALTEIKFEHDLYTDNYKNFGSWDIRFSRIRKAALENELTVIMKKRGIWKFISVLDEDTGTLYVFSKEKNLQKVMKEFGKDKIHYFHAFISLNHPPVEFDNNQLEFFNLFSEEYDEKRLIEAKKILQNDFSSVKQVVFVSAYEELGEIVAVKAKLFDKYFNLINVENWTENMNSADYSDIFISNEQKLEDKQQNAIIPTVKKNVIDRRRHFEETIPQKRKEKQIKRSGSREGEDNQ